MPVETLAPATNPPTPEATTDEVVVTPEQIEGVVQQFSPYSEVDNNGLNRTIFEWQGVTFAFTGREEKPIYPTLQNSHTTYLGRPSVLEEGTSPAPVEQPQEGPEHLLVEQSAYGFFALMERLQPENSHWAKQKDAVGQSHYDDEALHIIDMITALDSASVDSNAHSKIRQANPSSGEVVVAAAILGDERAQQLAKTATNLQDQQEKAATEGAAQEVLQHKSSEIIEPQEVLKPEDILVVHSTSYRPQKSERGYEVQTTHDAIGVPRATVHTALNHKVESHLAGNWDNSDYVLISPFDKMLKIDGPPSNINGADTWWTRNPGETLTFPEATLLAPGGAQGELFARTPEGELIYKTENFTEADVEIMAEQFGRSVVENVRKAMAKTGHQTAAAPENQRAIANILRDALVQWEISTVRNKPILRQTDERFMSTHDQARITSMAQSIGLNIPSGLHAYNETSEIENKVFAGERIVGMQLQDAKARRVAYASGMMGAGGTAYELAMINRENQENDW